MLAANVKPDQLLALTLPFQQAEQSALGTMQMRPSVIDQIFKCLKVLVDYISAIEAIQNLRRNVRRSTNCRRVSQDFRCFLYRLNNFLLFAASRLSARASAHAQTNVPAQVRKSLEVKGPPITSRMY